MGRPKLERVGPVKSPCWEGRNQRASLVGALQTRANGLCQPTGDALMAWSCGGAEWSRRYGKGQAVSRRRSARGAGCSRAYLWAMAVGRWWCHTAMPTRAGRITRVRGDCALLLAQEKKKDRTGMTYPWQRG
jgi:hypothetical protein